MQVRSSVCLKTDLRDLKEERPTFPRYHLFWRITLVLVSIARRLSEHCEVDTTDNFTTCHKTLNSRTATDRPVKIILLFCGKAMPR